MIRVGQLIKIPTAAGSVWYTDTFSVRGVIEPEVGGPDYPGLNNFGFLADVGLGIRTFSVWGW
jgi:hypothetical protein